MTFSRSYSPKVADLWLNWDSYPSVLKNITIVCTATSICIQPLSSIFSIKEKKVDPSKSLLKIKLCPLGIHQNVVSLFFSFCKQEIFSTYYQTRALTCNLLALGFKVNSVNDFHQTLENLLVHVFFQPLKWCS